MNTAIMTPPLGTSRPEVLLMTPEKETAMNDDCLTNQLACQSLQRAFQAYLAGEPPVPMSDMDPYLYELISDTQGGE